MAIAGNPKKMAKDISEGYASLNQAGLKKYTPQDLKIIKTNLEIVYREIRSEQVELNDHNAVKDKNTRMSRVNQATMVLRTFAKKRRIPI